MRRYAAILLIASLTACGDRPPAFVAVDTFCTRVEPFHGTDEERAALKRAVRAEPLIERFIRWAAGIDRQYDTDCKPRPTP